MPPTSCFARSSPMNGESGCGRYPGAGRSSPAAAQPPCPRSARAPPCGRDCWAARRHFQPTCRSSPRGRPREANHTTAARKTLAIRTRARTYRPGFRTDGRQRSSFQFADGNASGIGTVARHRRSALRTFETADARIGLMAKTAASLRRRRYVPCAPLAPVALAEPREEILLIDTAMAPVSRRRQVCGVRCYRSNPNGSSGQGA